MEQTSPNASGEKPHAGAQNKTLMGALAYLGILIIIPFLMAKDDPFVKFHIRQGLVLVVIELAIWVIGMFTYQFWSILQLANLAALVLAIIGIVNVTQNKEAELPIVGSFAKNFNI